ncbi:MAG: acyloxyacyl hydrolase [Deltaproteobacteria bacterium]|nr:acyloxyacyl hydrolase [Deltaproteobacteria bacterium]
MPRSFRPTLLALVAGLALTLPSPASGGDRSGLQELAFTTAYGFSDRDRIEVIPFYARFAWLFPDVIDEPLANVNLNLKWFLEPWVAGVTSPKQNAVEFGITPIGLKLEYDAGQQVVPFLIAGTGVMYTGLGGYDLSGPFEFASFGGAGIELFLTDQLAMSFAWRWRHISNAGIEEPNRGLDTQFVMVGLDWFPKR